MPWLAADGCGQKRPPPLKTPDPEIIEECVDCVQRVSVRDKVIKHLRQQVLTMSEEQGTVVRNLPTPQRGRNQPSRTGCATGGGEEVA